MKILFFLVVLCLGHNGSSQTQFEGSILGLPSGSTNVIVEYFYDDGWKNLQIIKDVNQGKFSTTLTFDHSGQYRIRLSSDPRKWGDFIIVREKLPAHGFHFNVEYAKLNGQPIAVEQSDENLAYSSVMSYFHAITLNPDSLERDDPRMLEKERAFAELMTGITRLYPGTYTAEVLSKVLPLPDAVVAGSKILDPKEIYQFQCLHAFDNLSLTNPNVLNHIGLIRRLNIGFNYFNENGKQEVYIDELMKKALVNEEMTTYMFKFLLDKMIDHRDEKGLTYLITWYANDCAESEHLEDGVKNMLKALDHCKPGNTIEFLTLPDLSGKLISSQEVFRKNKITIIMFWKGTCDHCKEFDPVLKKLYQKYQSQGVGVLAIGTDKLEQDWKNAAQENNAPWPSVYLMMNQRKDFSKRFPVPGTPTLMAVDSDGKILRRMIMRSKMEEAIVEMLNETKGK